MTNPHSRRRTRQARRLGALVAAVLLAAPPACRRDAAPPVDRETFVATYVELRVAGLTSPGGTLPQARREEILAARSVTEEDLLAFVEHHGRDVDYMTRLWGDVEERLAARLAAIPDTGS